MKATPCTVIINNRWGYCFSHDCKSITAAVRYAKESWGFAYRIYPIDAPIHPAFLIRSGFC